MENANGAASNDAELEGRTLDFDTEAHLASVAEKKRLWWRNAVINGAWIASWYAILMCRAADGQQLLGSRLLSYFSFTTNGCSLQIALAFPFRFSLLCCTPSFNGSVRRHYAIHGQKSFVQNTPHLDWVTGELTFQFLGIEITAYAT
jgi:hypothetical protein